MAKAMTYSMVVNSLNLDHGDLPRSRRELRHSPYNFSRVSHELFVERFRDIQNFSEEKINEYKASNPQRLPRGRPRAGIIPQLISDGTKSESNIKCQLCGRVFPRKKSLKAHLLTHQTERNISCDYPCCNSKFNQSGQLKSHQRIHTGENPFICPADGCTVRFKHSNRHCPTHHDLKLVRKEEDLEIVIQRQLDNRENRQDDEIRWLENYLEKHKRRSQQKLNEDLPTAEVSFDSSNDGSILAGGESNNSSCDFKSPLSCLFPDNGTYVSTENKSNIPVLMENKSETLKCKERSSEDLYAASLLFFFQNWKNDSSMGLTTSNSSDSDER